MALLHLCFIKHNNFNLISKLSVVIVNMPGFWLQYFKLKVKNPEKPIASGLEVPAVIEYIAHDSVEHTDRIVITVDGTVLEVPLRG